MFQLVRQGRQVFRCPGRASRQHRRRRCFATVEEYGIHVAVRRAVTRLRLAGYSTTGFKLPAGRYQARVNMTPLNGSKSQAKLISGEIRVK